MPTVAISLIISVIINFNVPSVAAFLITSLILGAIFIGLSFLIIKTIQNVKQKNTKKAILFGLLLVLSIIIFLYVTVVVPGYIILECWDSTPAHFRTNIFTGQCDFGGYVPATSCASEPWYYKPGCDIPDEEKIEILRNSQSSGTGLYEEMERLER